MALVEIQDWHEQDSPEALQDELERASDSLKASRWHVTFADPELESAYEKHEALIVMPRIKVMVNFATLVFVFCCVYYAVDAPSRGGQVRGAGASRMTDIVGLALPTTITLVLAVSLHCVPHRWLHSPAVLQWRHWIVLGFSLLLILCWSLPILVFDQCPAGDPCGTAAMWLNVSAEEIAYHGTGHFIGGVWMASAFITFGGLLAVSQLAPLQCVLLLVVGLPVYVSRNVANVGLSTGTAVSAGDIARMLVLMLPPLFMCIWIDVTLRHACRESFVMLVLTCTLKNRHIRKLKLREVLDSLSTPVQFIEGRGKVLGRDEARDGRTPTSKSYCSTRPKLGRRAAREQEGSAPTALPCAASSSVSSNPLTTITSTSASGQQITMGTTTATGVVVPRLASHPAVMRSGGAAAATALAIAGMPKQERQNRSGAISLGDVPPTTTEPHANDPMHAEKKAALSRFLKRISLTHDPSAGPSSPRQMETQRRQELILNRVYGPRGKLTQGDAS